MRFDIKIHGKLSLMEEKIKSVKVLGVWVDKVTMEKAVDLVMNWVKEGGKHYIVTVNPEFVMASRKDPEFKRVLNEADLAIPDGVGLKLASDMESIIAGVDLVEKLCERVVDYGFTTGFLGSRGGSAKKAAECLQKKYPGLKAVFAEDGPEVDMGGNEKLDVRSWKIDNEIRSRKLEKDQTSNIQFRDPPSNLQHPASNIDILFVAFGQVKQEKWIAKNLDKLPVKVMMGVGGSFDEISGRVPRIPKWVQSLGLKWLARLIIQPWRIKRQTALLKFFWLVTFKKGSQSYRGDS